MWAPVLILFLFSGAVLPANAQVSPDICRSQCGSDEECYNRCVGRGRGIPDVETRSKYDDDFLAPRRYDRTYVPHKGPSPSDDWNSQPEAAPPIAEKRGPAAILAVLDTSYDFLYREGGEEEGYGLYSYLILSRQSDRNAAFLKEVVESFPSAKHLPAEKNRINILYIPTQDAAEGKVSFSMNVTIQQAMQFLKEHYNFTLARHLYGHLCNAPAPAVTKKCELGFSQGPYLLTYGEKIGMRTPLPPPLLLVDLTRVDRRAFDYFISAYASQVKRPDFSDRVRIDDFRGEILNFVLHAGRWSKPITAALRDIVRHAEAKPDKPDAEETPRK